MGLSRSSSNSNGECTLEDAGFGYNRFGLGLLASIRFLLRLLAKRSLLVTGSCSSSGSGETRFLDWARTDKVEIDSADGALGSSLESPRFMFIGGRKSLPL